MKMNKIIYWIGIYAICAYTHDTFHEARDYLTNKIKDKEKKKSIEKNRSYNIGSGKSGGPINKIGF